jgi:N-dimethylarginine dimethylaminohydrolase
MCPPTYFGVVYEINPWMHVASPVDPRRAADQWEALRATYRDLGVEVVLADPAPGLPDMVFTANAGVTWDGRVVLSRFRHPQRQGEESRWRELFAHHGMPVLDTQGISFEGAGDALFVGDTLVCGYGFRTDRAAIPLVARALGVDAVELELVDPRYYHLDTCFCPLDAGTILFAPAAFSPASQARVRRLARRVIEVPNGIAAGFACNAMAIADVVVSSEAVEGLSDQLREAGYRALGLPMGEFMKSGGGVRCLSLPLPEIAGGAGSGEPAG